MKNRQIMISVVGLLSAFGGYQLQQIIQRENVAETWQTEKQPASQQSTLLGTRINEFTLSDVDGADRYFSEWRGNIVAINFWATWCPPCREEIPHFVELQHNYADQNVQFLGIALQEADEVRDFLLEFNVNYPSLVGGEDVIRLAKAMGNSIGALPYTVIVDRNGLIAFTKHGALSRPEVESIIQKLLQI